MIKRLFNRVIKKEKSIESSSCCKVEIKEVEPKLPCCSTSKPSK
ncbi:hypothetical protein QA612_01140 [Evansella sp. AB-P1]|nr:hypothetical protein [Evansella sp. AB-P1]MDG5786076.1 hypothetical protein [Evansella sp. AB-P1]